MLAILGEYMLLRQLVTPLVFVFWYASRFYSSKLLTDFFVLVFNVVLLASFSQKLEIAYMWVIFCVAMYSYGIRITGDHVFAACYAVLAAHFGGWLYEIPFFHPSTMFYSTRYPWLVNTQIVSGLFCVWLLTKRKIEANKTMLYSVIIYFLVTVFWLSGYQQLFPARVWWLPRVGVMIPLWATLTGIVGENKNESS